MYRILKVTKKIGRCTLDTPMPIHSRLHHIYLEQCLQLYHLDF